MTFDGKRLKRWVKENGVVKAQVWAMRSGRPFANLCSLRRNLLFGAVFSRTLISYDRLLNTYLLAKAIEARRLEGCYVECGVWRGGVGGLLGILADREGRKRHVHLFDSFEGCPQPTREDGKWAAQYRTREHPGNLEPIGLYAAPIEEVSAFLFDELKLSREHVSLHKGWFQETLPPARRHIGKIALLRIDADWYDSVSLCLSELYQNVVEGGYVILDDYGKYPGCRKAFEDFCRDRNLRIELNVIDESGVWFAKPRSVEQRITA